TKWSRGIRCVSVIAYSPRKVVCPLIDVSSQLPASSFQLPAPLQCSRTPAVLQSHPALQPRPRPRSRAVLPSLHCSTMSVHCPPQTPGPCQGRIRMITIGMNYRVLPGKEDHFERMFNNVLHSLETVTGHSKSALYKDVNALQSYLIVSEWASEDAFDAFVR